MKKELENEKSRHEHRNSETHQNRKTIIKEYFIEEKTTLIIETGEQKSKDDIKEKSSVKGETHIKNKKKIRRQKESNMRSEKRKVCLIE